MYSPLSPIKYECSLCHYITYEIEPKKRPIPDIDFLKKPKICPKCGGSMTKELSGFSWLLIKGLDFLLGKKKHSL